MKRRSKRRNDHIFDIDVEIVSHEINLQSSRIHFADKLKRIKNRLRKFPQLFWHLCKKYSTTQTEYVKLYLRRVLSFHRLFWQIISSRTYVIMAQCQYIMLFSLYNIGFIARVKWKCSNGPSSFDMLTDSLISHVWILFNFYIWHLLDVSLSIRFLSLCDKLQLSYRPQPSHSFYIQCSLISQTRSPHRSKPFA